MLNWLFPGRLPLVPKEPGKLNLFMLTQKKLNQGFYRDQELLKQTNGVRLTETFPYAKYKWDVRRILDAIYQDDYPDILYIHYNRFWTHQFIGLKDLPMLKIGFVGDPQDFILETPYHIQKKKWFQQARMDAYFTIAPQLNDVVRQGLNDPDLKIIDSHLAMEPSLFYPMGKRRNLDISSYGAHTTNIYPFRRQVRAWLEEQREFSYNKRQRVRWGGGNHAGHFATALNRCRSAFTCASIYGYTVAKYYEIPACGTLLFGEHTPLLAGFGFVDNVNFVCVSPDDFKEKINHYLKEIHPDDFATLVEAGRQLVHARHTWSNRIQTVVQDITTLLMHTHKEQP